MVGLEASWRSLVFGCFCLNRHYGTVDFLLFSATLGGGIPGLAICIGLLTVCFRGTAFLLMKSPILFCILRDKCEASICVAFLLLLQYSIRISPSTS